MKKIVFVSLLLASVNLQAQYEELPNQLSPAEMEKIKGGYTRPDYQQKSITNPPAFPVRTMAEWEEIQTLVVTYGNGGTGFYPTIVRKIIDIAQEECEVLVTCDDSTAAKNYLISGSVPLTNVRFLQVASDALWVRDYGAHTIYKDDVDSLMLVDWIYNRPTRPNDDVMPDFQAAYKGIPLIATTQAPNDLVNTGGNWMVDGFGTAFASKLILDENAAGNSYGVTAKTETDIDNIMDAYMGINRYIKMETLPYDGIHHIDMHMKLLDEETLLVSEYPTGESDGPQIELNLQYVLSNFNSVYGTPYKVIRIPAPPSSTGLYPADGGSYRTYSNNVFVNKTLIVPGYRTEYDTIAQRILEAALPGYDIQFIDCDNSGSNIISASGAIHCITNAIGVNDPLLIQHQSLTDTYDDVNPYTVNAFIKHKSGISSATLYYTTNLTSGYQSVAMTNSSGNNWTANIPAQPANSTVYYYIEGNSISGKTQVRPIVAPDGYFHFKVLDNASAITENNELTIGKLFPNPSDGLTCLELNIPLNSNVKIDLINILGQEVQTVHCGALSKGNQKIFFHTSALEAGTYLLKISTGNAQATTRLIVK